MNSLKRYTYYIQTVSDFLMLILSFWISFEIRRLIPSAYGDITRDAYQRIFFLELLSYFLLNFFGTSRDDFLDRTFVGELKQTARLSIGILFIFLLYSYFSKSGASYSRLFMLINTGVSFLALVGGRVFLRKMVFPGLKRGRGAESVAIVGDYEDVMRFLPRLTATRDWRFTLAGFIITDRDMTDHYLEDLPVLGTGDHLISEVYSHGLDAIVLVTSDLKKVDHTVISELEAAGKTVHLSVDGYDALRDKDYTIDRIGESTVLSFRPIRQAGFGMRFVKRFFDIVISLLLLPLLGILALLTRLSGGKVLVDSVRVGRGGRRFYLHRFRTTALLQAGDEAGPGLIEKDPAFGRALRFTHLNGLPEILNVLAGDMSLIGPKAPTVAEFLSYTPGRRQNLSVRPGVIGYWSVKRWERDSRSGGGSRRTEAAGSDADELARQAGSTGSGPTLEAADRSYVEAWSILKDLQILFLAAGRFLTSHSLRAWDDRDRREEEGYLKVWQMGENPMIYGSADGAGAGRAGHTASTHTADSRPAGPADLNRAASTPYISPKGYRALKRTTDILLSLIALILLSPVFLILSIAVMADDGGAPVYAQKRIGRFGRRIRVYKFRSMRRDAGRLDQLLTKEQLRQYREEFKLDNDPRITKVGAFLRRTSLDELPQLVNILKGDMSIVGPRPLVEKEIRKWYGGDDSTARLLAVRPGLTGYWQAYARNNATYASGKRQEMEMHYISHASIGFDLRIFFHTIGSVLHEEGAK